MKRSDIDGLRVTPLRRIPDERGAIFHMLRSDTEGFEQFGEIYFSQVYPHAIKAWHLHQRMTLNYAVPIGMVKLVCFDDREQSPTRGNLVELFIGELNYQLVTIPPLVWNGFKGIGTTPALIANCATEAHDPEDILRTDPFDLIVPSDTIGRFNTAVFERGLGTVYITLWPLCAMTRSLTQVRAEPHDDTRGLSRLAAHLFLSQLNSATVNRNVPAVKVPADT